MGRSPCCEKLGLKKGPWAPEEDKKLLAYIEEHGHGSWRALPEKAGLQRCGKSCRLRWANYLRPDIKRGKFSLQEERTIIQLHALLGNRWSAIATHLPKRTDNEIKNYWNTHLKKRLTKMGIDPVTHKPKCGTGAGNLSHMAQWESARLEAEARLVRESKLLSNMYSTNPFQPQLQGFSTSAQLLHKAAAPPPLCLDVLKAWQRAFAAAGDLESPTSTLNFPENAFPNPIISYSNALEAENDWKYLEKLINFPGNKEKMENLMEFHDNMTYNSMDSVWIAELLSTASPNAAIPSSMEGFADLLVDNSGDNNGSGGSCGGDFGGNDKYWNLVNFATSDSPVF